MGGESSLFALVVVGVPLIVDVPRAFETNPLNAAREQRLFALWNGLDAWARPLLAAAAILLIGRISGSMLLGNTVGCVAIYFLFRGTFVRGRGVAVSPDRDEWLASVRHDFVRFALPLVRLALLSWIISVSDRYVVAALSGTDAAGLYAAAYGLGSAPFLAMPGIGVLTFRPILFEAVARGNSARERRAVLVWLVTFAAGGLAGVLLIYLLSPWIVWVALGPEFRRTPTRSTGLREPTRSWRSRTCSRR